MALGDPVTSLTGGASAGQTFENAGKAIFGAVNEVTAPETKKQGIERRSAQDKYAYTFLQYPLDLAKGSGARHPYWMTFYINVQDLSHFEKPPSKGPAPLSTVDINARQTRTLAKNIPNSTLGFGRKTHRTTSAIRLYMPDTLAWSYSHGFREASLSGIPLTGVAQALTAAPAAADSLVKGYQQGGVPGLLASLQSKQARGAVGPVAEVIGGLLPGVGSDLALQFLGISVNPQIDVIYQSPALRQFTFDFLFAPRNSDEAAYVSDIITEFKFHAAPEVFDKGSGIGRYFVPPSEFDIEFSVNTMGKISTCVLENLTVDYAPSGAAFYADDRPVGTRMTLQFRELEYITKELIRDEEY